LPQVSKLPVRNPVDQLAIDAWMAVPPTTRPAGGYPLILEIHGGPATMYGSGFATEIQRYAAEGYLTVWANQRGSLGYGEAFALKIDSNFPGKDDLGDLMAVVDAAIATGQVDSKRIYVTGGSAGGTMTAWSVAHTDRFAAAAAVNPVINWTSVMLAGDTAAHVARHQVRATPWEDQALFWRLSPLSKVGSVKTPTMLMVGDDDWRAPPFEAEQFYTALKLRGIDTMLVRIPESGHSIGTRPSQQIAKTDNIIAWFRQHDPLTKSSEPVAQSVSAPAQ
jgi:acylaminoacyl-peptidase